MRDAALPMEDMPFPGDWTSRGACQLVPTEVFFPSRGQAVEPAKEVCGACPVLAECREYALGIADLKGVWGGLTEVERKKLRRRRDTPPSEASRAEPSAPCPDRSAKGALYRTLVELAANPGRWARVAWYPGAHTASAIAARLKAGLVAVPNGEWDFDARSDDGGSGLWAVSLGHKSGERSTEIPAEFDSRSFSNAGLNLAAPITRSSGLGADRRQYLMRESS